MTTQPMWLLHLGNSCFIITYMSKAIQGLDKEIRKLAQPRALTLRWAKTQRFYINPKFRCIFDIESSSQHFRKDIKEKVKLANMREEAQGEPEYRVTEYDYRRFLIWMQRHPNVMRARVVMLLSKFQDERLIEHVFIMERKALESEDPNKLINLHKFITGYHKATMEVLGLNINKRKPKQRKQESKPLVDENGMVVGCEKIR